MLRAFHKKEEKISGKKWNNKSSDEDEHKDDDDGDKAGELTISFAAHTYVCMA